MLTSLVLGEKNVNSTYIRSSTSTHVLCRVTNELLSSNQWSAACCQQEREQSRLDVFRVTTEGKSIYNDGQTEETNQVLHLD